MLTLFGRTHRVLRRLRRAPLFTAIALITLAVAVGANTVIFSVVNGVLLKPLSYPNPDRLFAVDHSSQEMGFKKMGIAPSIYFVYREQNTTLADIGAYDEDELDVTGAGAPEHVRVLDVTDGTLPLLGVSPALVIIQVALSVVLLICSGLMIRTFQAMMHVSPGFTSPETIQAFGFYIPATQIPDTSPERVIRMDEAIVQKIASISGVSSVSIGRSVPMDDNNANNPVYVQNRTHEGSDIPPVRRFNYAAPGFFSTLGTRLLAGGISHGRTRTKGGRLSSSPGALLANTGVVPRTRWAKEYVWCLPILGARSSASPRTSITTALRNPRPRWCIGLS